MRLVAVASAAAVSAFLTMTGAGAQTANEIIGTWAVVSAVADQDGDATDVFGDAAQGTILFGADGRYALVFMRSDLPKMAGPRDAGTAEENAAVVGGSIAHFGSYVVEDAGKTLVLRIEASTYPNWAGAEQRRPMSLSGDELQYVSPGSAGLATYVTMRRVKSQ